MAISTTQQTQEILNNHLQAFGRGDVDAILADYADDASFFTSDGVLHGKPAIRSMFEKVIDELPPGTSIQMAQEIVEGDIAYCVWSARSPRLDVRFATDTMVVRDGKIAVQTFAAQMQPVT